MNLSNSNTVCAFPGVTCIMTWMCIENQYCLEWMFLWWMQDMTPLAVHALCPTTCHDQ